MNRFLSCLVAAFFVVVLSIGAATRCLSADLARELQQCAMQSGQADWGHWGADPEKYSDWKTHSNRLIPVYTFGIGLDSVCGERSPYRDRKRIQEIYGVEPDGAFNPSADYFDQTDVAALQRAALADGKKYVVLIVFDGMDWETTRAAATYVAGRTYSEGRGRGLCFQDYRGASTDFGWFVTSPHRDDAEMDVNAQLIVDPNAKAEGGYDVRLGGPTPWSRGEDPLYLIGQSESRKHIVTDSASSATAMTSGVKTYNSAINVDARGRQVAPVSREFQARGRAVGVVTSVPISHATPASAYANNVSRNDFQDLSRDLLGLPSVAHRSEPLPGVDVLLGAGWGDEVAEGEAQGANFTPGNKYLTAADLRRIDVRNGGRYRTVVRTAGQSGAAVLDQAAAEAGDRGQRLFGMFGVPSGHLPFQTADGAYDPTAGGRYPQETYSEDDITENPTLADMTAAALSVLERDPDGFWLMIEAGDVDWANHDTNIDSSIGAVKSGDDAFRAVAEWAERRDCWDETAVILTADHGHYLHLLRPEVLIPSAGGAQAAGD